MSTNTMEFISKDQIELLKKVESTGATINESGQVTITLSQLEKLKVLILQKNSNKLVFPKELASILKQVEAAGDCC